VEVVIVRLIRKNYAFKLTVFVSIVLPLQLAYYLRQRFQRQICFLFEYYMSPQMASSSYETGI
jgi:hypothetical protein